MIAESRTIAERVHHLVHPGGKRPRVWGDPLVSTTPTSMAIQDLAERMEVLEEAVREIALRLERVENDD